MRLWIAFLVLSLLNSGCSAGTGSARVTPAVSAPTVTIPARSPTAVPFTVPSSLTPPPPTPAPTDTATALPTVTSTSAAPPAPIVQTGSGGVPAFDHIILIVFENHDYAEVIGSSDLPNFNQLAQQNVLLTQYHGVAHPSLPNYLALIGGSTFGVTTDCFGCFLDQPSLPDRIEAGGRTWKTYQEKMNKPCDLGLQQGGYDQNHNPFVYFNPVRKDTARCAQSVVPFTQLNVDLSAGQLPNFVFIMPDLCNSAHSCPLSKADTWLRQMMDQLQASPALGQNYLIAITFDESSSDNSSCCGLPARAGGRVPAILISPLAKSGYQDDTPLSHYSMLKTILLSWNLPALGNTDNPETLAITSVWR